MAHPLLCNPGDKAQIEASNTVAQLSYVADLVIGRRIKEIRESHIRELHRLAVQHIYPCGGNYRDARFRLQLSDGEHHPPEAALIPSLVLDLVDECNKPERGALERSSYALWRLNWIHPFAGGNGRTARALAYLILCIDLGGLPPGIPSIPGAIAADRDGYLSALRATDAAMKTIQGATVSPRRRRLELLPMETFLGALFAQQVFSNSPILLRLTKIMYSLVRWLGR